MIASRSLPFRAGWMVVSVALVMAPVTVPPAQAQMVAQTQAPAQGRTAAQPQPSLKSRPSAQALGTAPTVQPTLPLPTNVTMQECHGLSGMTFGGIAALGV